jgi:hypothetical protein
MFVSKLLAATMIAGPVEAARANPRRNEPSPAAASARGARAFRRPRTLRIGPGSPPRLAPPRPGGGSPAGGA